MAYVFNRPASRSLGLVRSLSVIVALAALIGSTIALRADAPHVYAITGARVVTASGPVLEAATVVLRRGVIEAVGPGVTAPPDATVIDGKGLAVYPGLIDMGTSAALNVPTFEPPRDARTRMEIERVRRQALIRGSFDAAAALKADAPELKRMAAAGITTILATPPGDGITGRSALVNVVGPEDPPQVGQVADERRGLFVLRAPVALHVAFPSRESDIYPASLMGGIAFVRQAFLDAAHYQQARAAYEKSAPGSMARPVYDPGLEALQPAVARKVPVVFEADGRVEIRRALAVARELGLDAVIGNGVEADLVAPDLAAAGARVIYSLNFPTRPRTLAPDADEPLRVLRQRADAPKVPGALARAGVPFAFKSGGLKEPADFLKNAARAVKAGLPADAAVRALTIEAARIAGVADRLGSVEKGKLANLVIADGDLFAEKTRIRYVFVDGRMVEQSR